MDQTNNTNGIKTANDLQTVPVGQGYSDLARRFTATLLQIRRRNLNRQKPRTLRHPAKPRIAKPLEHKIGIHIITPRNLRNRNPGNPRLSNNTRLLLSTPNPPTNLP